mmetsp:Transcript_95487/g.270029  ORF Transcript_95487/g.270029 Transcript_95487/m.270029 type:complete len:466 (-) Transcript_95487:3529-4926(-)
MPFRRRMFSFARLPSPIAFFLCAFDAFFAFFVEASSDPRAFGAFFAFFTQTGAAISSTSEVGVSSTMYGSSVMAGASSSSWSEASAPSWSKASAPILSESMYGSTVIRECFCFSLLILLACVASPLSFRRNGFFDACPDLLASSSCSSLRPRLASAPPGPRPSDCISNVVSSSSSVRRVLPPRCGDAASGQRFLFLILAACGLASRRGRFSLSRTSIALTDAFFFFFFNLPVLSAFVGRSASARRRLPSAFSAPALSFAGSSNGCFLPAGVAWHFAGLRLFGGVLGGASSSPLLSNAFRTGVARSGRLSSPSVSSTLRVASEILAPLSFAGFPRSAARRLVANLFVASRARSAANRLCSYANLLMSAGLLSSKILGSSGMAVFSGSLPAQPQASDGCEVDFCPSASRRLVAGEFVLACAAGRFSPPAAHVVSFANSRRGLCTVSRNGSQIDTRIASSASRLRTAV